MSKLISMSYAQVAAWNVVIPDVTKNVPLIIRPTEKQSIEKTKAGLNKKVDLISFKITNDENRRNGTVVIWIENIAERENIKEEIENEIS